MDRGAAVAVVLIEGCDLRVGQRSGVGTSASSEIVSVGLRGSCTNESGPAVLHVLGVVHAGDGVVRSQLTADVVRAKNEGNVLNYERNNQFSWTGPYSSVLVRTSA